MSLRLTILGCHSATPRSLAYNTSQFLELNGDYFLIDCGEGTQRQIRKYKIKFSKIKKVFISHLHGDHFFGLIGLISTFNLLNRKEELIIYGPEGIEEIILLQLKLSKSWVDYPLIFHELNSPKSQLIMDNENVEVFTIPLKHRIYTNGFLFREKPQPRKLDMSQIMTYPEIDICDYQNLKNGKDFKLENGRILKNSVLTLDPPKCLSYAFCSDTAYSEEILPLLHEVDLLYHESTFLEQHQELAKKTKHSTAKEAATIAQKGGVKRLLLGHYSSRYKNTAAFLEEAKDVFSNVDLADTGMQIDIDN